MPKYQVSVFTGNLAYASTFNNVFIKLVGNDRESDRIRLMGAGWFLVGLKSTFIISCPASLGDLIMVEVNKEELPLFPQDAWFVDKVEVTSPEEKLYKFPIYHWINDGEVHRFREGTAVKVLEEHNPLAIYARQKELQHRKEEYCWEVYADGMPHCMKADDACALPPEVQFSFTKDIEFKWTALQGLLEMQLSHLNDCEEPWTDFDSLYRVFCCHKTDASDFVQKNWKDDAYFGYQFLNGVNPILIRCCTSLPSNFPVTDDMVSLEGGATLTDEMEKGNIFLCDYKILDGVKTNVINGEVQYLAAPLVLLHKTPDDSLKPVAIQLKQTPSEDNPIFVPADPKYDWLLAKTFVRSAEFNYHELNVHLLRTHLLAEVFTVALLRNVPRVHPLYKLLVPHTRFTLQINVMARQRLISKDGVFTLNTASGGEGMRTILKRSLSTLTYSSLCMPEDITERGVESVPNYYYRDDGLRLWDIIHRFVKGVIHHYYKTDQEVQDDSELQEYIKDIFEHGFLSKTETGIPQSFSTVDEVVKFVTVVIFTSSAQHSAVNTGQLDIGGWMPNFPPSLQLAPPTIKGRANEHTLLQTLPDVNTTVHGLAVLWLLSTQSTDFVALGKYPQELFTEDVCCKLTKDFEKELKDLDEAIDRRNKNLKLPYTYMEPKTMENSVSL
ncbi:polyunsaturated fatty acid lipoxygenase ALOX15B-like [Periophthalmus magnuspinnatus]|uniref:polyunsaturated fatty acid lipoxygenase ALOX15B-like n=1 Tax=Periophthalmus magnuspinnatus TaxID=409849 RepID=UPI002436AFBE|nr:polyunsaturated fatty acid lipoxygenase ALOX15B-like [Periophthalmus magnuspinnatus]